MINQTMNDIVTDELKSGAIYNTEFHGFEDDYLVIHCLLKKHGNQIYRFLEIGTNMGTGTNIICNALGRACTVLSLDLPPTKADAGSYTGRNCKYPFTQLTGDSTTFDYTLYFPVEGWYIDANHVYENVRIETAAALSSSPKIIIWHDSDIKGVYDAIVDSFVDCTEYNLYRVTDTRISYALRVDSK